MTTSLVNNESSSRTRIYQIDRQYTKESSIHWRYVIPPSGDYIISWKFWFEREGGYKISKNRYVHFNDVKLKIDKNEIDLVDMRKKMKSIELPKSELDNKLLKLEQLFIAGKIEAKNTLDKMLKTSKQDKGDIKDFPVYSNEIINDTLWYGGMIVLLDFGSRPPPQIYIQETYYPYCSLINEKKDNKIEKIERKEKEDDKGKEKEDNREKEDDKGKEKEGEKIVINEKKTSGQKNVEDIMKAMGF
jgi:hypothetical protein